MAPWFRQPPRWPRRQPILYGAGFGLVLLLIVFFYAGGVDPAHLRLPRLAVPVDLAALPAAAFSSLLRMAAAYLAALLFSLSVAYLAVTRRWAERLLMPVLDVLQSVPVLGFFPAAVFVFINMARGDRIGIELASIFLIFTAQVWNMVFGVYEAWSTLPGEAAEAAHAYGVRGWLRFRRLYWPACLPRLIYNSIASWSNGWYFLIACEIIAIGPLNYELPGLGSFLVHAAEAGRADLLAGGLAVLLTIVIVMEFALWRPLSIWAAKFRYEQAASTMHPQESFMIQWWTHSPVTRRTRRLFRRAGRAMVRLGRSISSWRDGGGAPAAVTRRTMPPWLWRPARWLLLVGAGWLL
ncbi:MAG: ABC transporter permease subunit, partial [Nitrospirota bacterium]